MASCVGKGVGRYQADVFTIFESLDIFRAAVFLWITPFFAALSMMDLAVFN